jgi:hypothetical protein
MGDENAKLLLENLIGEIPSGDIGVYRRIILKWI